MRSSKLAAGQAFPEINVRKLGGGDVELGRPNQGFDWQLVVVYRGKHCPICTKYLVKLNEVLPELNAIGVDVVAVSADSRDKAEHHMQQVAPDFDIGFDLTIAQMELLGLYISQPRSDAETDHPFSEPGVFVINSHGDLQVVDISNAPFARPELESLLMGLKFIRNPDNEYPVRGTYGSQV